MLRPVYPRFRVGWYWLPTLEAAFKDRAVKDCLRCPHRGIAAGNLPRDRHGRVVRPAHGLRWNLRTGRIESDDEARAAPEVAIAVSWGGLAGKWLQAAGFKYSPRRRND